MNVATKSLLACKTCVARATVRRSPFLSPFLNAGSTRLNSTDEHDKAAPPIGNEWRKTQLEKLEKKFAEPLEIESDEELQPMWQQMESRVKNRRPRTLRETGGKTGRVNVKKTDEEMWLQEGLYDEDSKT